MKSIFFVRVFRSDMQKNGCNHPRISGFVWKQLRYKRFKDDEDYYSINFLLETTGEC